MPTPTYHVSGLALAIDVDQAQVSRWKAAGMPFDKRGRITLAKAVAWIRTNERRERPTMGSPEAMQRKMAAEAELAELKLARERGDVAPAAQVLAAAEDEATRVRGIVTHLASEFAPLLAARLGCPLRDASAVLRTVSDGVLARMAAQDMDTEQEAAA